MMRQALLGLSRSKVMQSKVAGSRLAWRSASRFVAGQDIDAAMSVVRALNGAGMTVTLDHLGENVTQSTEAAASRDAYLRAVAEIEATGVQSHISLKLTALGMDLGDAVAEAHLRTLLAAAAAVAPPIFVRIDMEGSDYTQRTLDLYRRVAADHRNVGIVIQSYLYRSDQDVEDLIAMGAPVRLVKGAYLEPETIAYPDKSGVDAAYVRQAARLLSPEARAAGVAAAIATHDAAIIDWTKRHAAEHEIPRDAFEFQMLFGIRRDLQTQLVADGYRMRVYVPYGRQWYPYFMRRLAERPENIGFVLRNLWQEAT